MYILDSSPPALPSATARTRGRRARAPSCQLACPEPNQPSSPFLRPHLCQPGPLPSSCCTYVLIAGCPRASPPPSLLLLLARHPRVQSPRALPIRGLDLRSPCQPGALVAAALACPAPALLTMSWVVGKAGGLLMPARGGLCHHLSCGRYRQLRSSRLFSSSLVTLLPPPPGWSMYITPLLYRSQS